MLTCCCPNDARMLCELEPTPLIGWTNHQNFFSSLAIPTCHFEVNNINISTLNINITLKQRNLQHPHSPAPPFYHVSPTIPRSQPWPRRGGQALRPSSPMLVLLRSTLLKVLLLRKASAKAYRVGTRQWPSRQPSRGELRTHFSQRNYLHGQVAARI